MRPIKLEFEAFGPFADNTIIDFSDLKDNIFVISGPTGSGKTTIFDAISFALFGEASGEGRGKIDYLRSDFVEPDINTIVKFTFEIAYKIYYIVREYKQTKDGVKIVRCTLEYEDTFCKDKIVISGKTNVDKEVEAILGLNKNQFRQIVMLPQGEFKKLLVSDTKDKQEIFRHIFGTQIYKDIQDELKQRAKNVKDKYILAQSNIDNCVKQLGEFDTQDYENIMKQTIQYIDAEEKEIKTLDQEVKKLEKNINELYQQKERAKNNNKVLQSLKNTKKDIEDKQKFPIKEYESKIELIKKVKDLSPMYNNLVDYKKKVKDLTATIETINKELNTNKLALDTKRTANSQLEEKLKNHDELKKQHTLLEELIPKMQQREKLQQDLVVHIKNVDNSIEHNKKISDSIKEHKKKKEKLEQEIKKLYEIKLEREKINNMFSETTTQLKKLREAFKLVKDYEEVVDRYAKNKKSYEAKREEYDKIKKRYEKLERIYSDEQAGILASTLEDDMPCPVCGSTQHPSPASISANLKVPDKKELDMLKKSVEYSNTQKDEACTKVAAIHQDKQNKYDNINKILLELQIGEYTENTSKKVTEKGKEINKCSQNLEEKLKGINAQLSLETKWQEDLEECKSMLTKLENESESEQQKLKKLEIDTAKLQQGLVAIEVNGNQSIKDITDKRTQIDNQIKSEQEAHKVLQEEIKNLSNVQIEKSTTKENQLNRQQELENQIAKGKADLQKELVSLDIDLEKFRNILEDIVNIEMYEEAVSKYKEELHALKVAESELQKQLKDEYLKDINEIEFIISKIKCERNKLHEQSKQRNGNKKSKCNVLDNMKVLYEEYKIAHEEYAIIGEISEVANGKKNPHISYENYVLGAYFDDIINAANSRLGKMTSGRFYLVKQQQDVIKGTAQRGLGISVYDNYTNTSRDAKTLSGGESFKASLALALGLSDLIQENSGGIQIDTMFIDEGFGTLDYQSLDSAVDTLMELQIGGRLVGVISHVDELKDRIPIKLEVSTSNRGSLVKWAS
ncbi:MAG: hypothetical protein BEN19_03310 [Epulopiscium sp. Nuni2H_MBin003]|nr:MAG: hypothetical protein BEN19_03310 [Epulopiscium sp. Nuni2H_MBin003]